jgi:hypothetical protein
MEELSQAVEEMAQQKSQLKLYRWAVGLLVGTCTCVVRMPWYASSAHHNRCCPYACNPGINCDKHEMHQHMLRAVGDTSGCGVYPCRCAGCEDEALPEQRLQTWHINICCCLSCHCRPCS